MSERSHVQRIYWIGGSKRGVGKSMMTMASLDHLIERGDRLALAHRDGHIEPRRLERLRGAGSEWSLRSRPRRLLDRLRQQPAPPTATARLVVNTATRNNVAVRQHGQTLNTSLDEFGAPLVTLWIITWQRDGLELLEDFVEAVPKTIERRGGKSLTLPDLRSRRRRPPSATERC